MITLIKPDWPAPIAITAYSTTRTGGVSKGKYTSLNLAKHVADDDLLVEKNRQLLITAAGLPESPLWLEQVHGTQVHELTDQLHTHVIADAVYSKLANRVCVVMTADCLPVLFCSVEGNEVAAAHAGWRGLYSGVLEQTLTQFTCERDQILAWFGPAISQPAFEVGEEVRQKFISEDQNAGRAFIAKGTGKYLADIYQLARLRLNKAGVNKIYGGEFCTVNEVDRFFSYRRDGDTGRMASLIWFSE